jgi:hypothetical protein
MTIHKFISLLNAKAGRDEEFNEWYAEQHIPDVLRIPGFVNAQRYCLSTGQLPGMTPPWKYMVIYEISGESPAEALQELGRRIAGSGMVISDALASDVAAWTYSPIGPLQERGPDHG